MTCLSSLVACLGHLALTVWLGVDIWQIAELQVTLPLQHSLAEPPLETFYAGDFMPKPEQEWSAKDKTSELVHI